MTADGVLSHLSLGVRDLAAAGRLYDALLGPLGVVRVWETPRGIGYGFPGQGDKLALFGQPTAPAGSLAAGPGFHLAFAAPDRAAVDAFHVAALRGGGQCDGPPGLRPHYGPTYYAAFVVDLDGHRLECVHQ